MKLFSLPFFKKKQKSSNYYLGLFLKENEGIAYAIEKTTSGLRVLSEEKFQYAEAWTHIVEDVDQVLVKLEKDVQAHFVDTIFFTYSDLIDHTTHQIKKHYLSRIKELVKNLELKALGYIECFEAVVHFMDKRDDMPLTSVLLELSERHVNVFVYKGGHSVFRKTIDRTPALVDDLSSVFTDAKAQNILLPSRIILYNSKDLDQESALILSHKWPSEVFIQLPKVEIMRPEEIRTGLVEVFELQLLDTAKTEVKKELPKEEAPKEVMGFVVGEEVVPKPPRISLFSRVTPFFNKLKSSGFRNVSIFIGLALLFSALFLNEFFLHTAVLKIYLPSKSYGKELSLITSTVGGAEIAIKVATQGADLSQTSPTSGSREVGEKAKGDIMIYSFDDKPRSISKNTVLTSENLTFLTSQDIQVASASEAFVGGNLVKQPGKTKVEVVAQDIGQSYNLEKGKRLKVGDLTEAIYFGQVDASLSGGNKKTVKTVARADIDNLKDALLEKVTSSEATLMKNDDSNLKPLMNLTEVELTNVQSSKEIGEEADKITLSAKGEITYYLYNESEMKQVLIKQFADQIPSDYYLNPDKVSYKLVSSQKIDDNVTIEIEAKVKATPEIASEDILQNTRFKSREELSVLLKEKYKVTGYDLNVKGPLPFFNNRVPLFSKNLIILFSSL